jgi:hypothetical protein
MRCLCPSIFLINSAPVEEQVRELHEKWQEELDEEGLRAVVRGIKTGQWRRSNGKGRRGGLDEDDDIYDNLVCSPCQFFSFFSFFKTFYFPPFS